MKHRDRGGEQCQALDTIKMVAGVCFHLLWVLSQRAQPRRHPRVPVLTEDPGEGLGWGAGWTPASFSNSASMVDTPLLPFHTAPPQSSHALFSRDKTRINALSWVMASPWEPIRQAQQLKESALLAVAPVQWCIAPLCELEALEVTCIVAVDLSD